MFEKKLRNKFHSAVISARTETELPCPQLKNINNNNENRNVAEFTFEDRIPLFQEKQLNGLFHYANYTRGIGNFKKMKM